MGNQETLQEDERVWPEAPENAFCGQIGVDAARGDRRQPPEHGGVAESSHHAQFLLIAIFGGWRCIRTRFPSRRTTKGRGKGIPLPEETVMPIVDPCPQPFIRKFFLHPRSGCGKGLVIRRRVSSFTGERPLR